MFDAGAIMAHLDVDTTAGDRHLDRFERRVRDLERQKHHIRLDAVFDESSVGRARKLFAQLDNALSRDAASRLRSSPQGSVLGALSSMLSSHPVSGASPGAVSSARGMLGRGGAERAVLAEAAGGGGGRGGHWYGGFSIPGGPYVGRSFGRGLAGGIGPGIPGVSARMATMVGVGGAALGAVPAAVAPLAALGVGGAGLGVLALGAKTLIGSKQDPGELYKSAQQMMKSLQQAMQQGAQPLVAPLRRAFTEIPHILHGLIPVLHQVFAGAATLIQPLLHGLADLVRMIGPGLGQAFRAAAPLIRPLIDGFGQLVRGILPGLNALLRAAHPAITAFASVLGMLGRGIGQMLRAFAPAIRASAPIFQALGSVLAALFPIVGRLAAVFARALGPVLVQLASVIRSLVPILAPLIRMIASLAAAVLADFASALKAVLILIRGMEPSIRILAGALSQVFGVLESSGVFAAFGAALEQIAPLLARLVNTLVRGFAPVLPILIKLLSQVSQIMITLFAAGLTAGLTLVIGAITGLLKHFPVLSKVILVAAAAWGVLTAVMAVNPLVAIGAAIIILIGIVYELVKHWHRVWTDIKNWSADAWHFLTHGWGQFLIPGLTLIRYAVELVSKHWRQAWQNMVNWVLDAWHAIDNDVFHPIQRFLLQYIPGWFDSFIGFVRSRFVHPFQDALSGAWHWVQDHVFDPMHNFLFRTVPGWFDTAVGFIGKAWWAIRSAIRGPVAWVIDNVLDGLINAFDWITSHLGLSKPIKPVHPFGLAKGGHLPGYGGGDRHLALLESGETVVPKEEATTPEFAAWAKARGIRGYQHGGRVGQGPPSGRSAEPPATRGRFGPIPGVGNVGTDILHKIADIGKISAAVFTGNTRALTNAIRDLLPGRLGGATAGMASMLGGMVNTAIKDVVRWLIGHGGSSGNAIADYAMRWIGRIPYVWGGTAVPGGADCSGFVQAIYRHFGISAPRTSEQQGSWVHRAPPTPGGLAFYHSPPGGPDPGHVAIVRNSRSVISQGGGMGPQVEPLRMLPLLWTGVPPGGFGRAGVSGRGRWTLPGLEGLWTRAGGPGGYLAHVAGAIALAESGGDPRAHNPSGASGLWQILGRVRPGNLFNPYVNALNAVAKYHAANGFSPWVTWTTGAYRRFMDTGGWLHPGPNLSFNATGQREAVLTPSQSRAFVDLGEAARLFSRGHGQPGTGHLMRDVYLMLPEGSTVAQALNEVTFRLQAYQLAGYAGVP